MPIKHLYIFLVLLGNISFAQTLSITIASTEVHCTGYPDGTANAEVSGGTTPYQYLWSNGGTIALLTGLEIGDYGLTVTDNLSITESSTVTIVANYYEPLNIIAPDTVFTCLGEEIEVCAEGSGGNNVDNYNYTWSNGFTSDSVVTSCQTLYETADTDHRVILTDECMFNDTTNVVHVVYPTGAICYCAMIKEGCAPFTVEFNSGSSMPNSITEWDIDGNGTVDGTGSQFEWTYDCFGIYDISYKTTTPQGCETTYSLAQYITVWMCANSDGCSLSVNELDEERIISFKNDNIVFASGVKGVLEIYNVSGQLVLKQNLNQELPGILLNALESGIYFYQLRDVNHLLEKGKFFID